MRNNYILNFKLIKLLILLGKRKKTKEKNKDIHPRIRGKILIYNTM